MHASADPVKIYLFNDTSRSRHAGCKAVMRSIRAELATFAAQGNRSVFDRFATSIAQHDVVRAGLLAAALGRTTTRADGPHRVAL
jgi:hypothetical protein